MPKSLRVEAPAILWLILVTLYYDHRVFGVYSLETDMLTNIYYRLNQKLIEADHNPFQWYYSSYLPVHGLYNPVLKLCEAIFDLFGGKLSEVARAVWINILASVLLHNALVLSVYLFFRKFEISRTGAFLGAVIVGFSGFHLSGIRIFNHMYVLSYLCVPWVFWSFLEIARRRQELLYTCLGALFIGLSLLGGSNVPLFLFLPFFFLIPLACTKKIYWKSYRYFSMAIAGGIGCAAAILLPGIVFLKDTLRFELEFMNTSVPMWKNLVSLFLRDWWWTDRLQYFESDPFLGLPIICLTILGICYCYRQSDRMVVFYIGLISVAIMLSQVPFFPPLLAAPFEWFFEILSVRGPGRLLVLIFIPAAYFSARAIDRIAGRGELVVLCALFCLNLILVRFVLAPRWDNLLDDSKSAAWVGLIFALIAWIGLCVRCWTRTQKHRYKIWVVLGITGMFVFSPIQWTIFHGSYLGNEAPQDGTEWPTFFGFDFDYHTRIEKAEKFFIEAPGLLVDEHLSRGRILEVMDLGTVRTHFHAPQSQRYFAFSALKDPASPARVRHLFELRKASVMDLNAVCWVLKGENIQVRDSCLPRAFLVGGAKMFATDRDTLHWMGEQQRKDFQTTMAIQCGSSQCPSDGITGYGPIESTRLFWEVEQPGLYRFQVDLQRPAYLFISTPYRFDWEAKVNGQATPVYRANYAFMGIRVPAGASRVSLELNPWVRETSEFLSLVFFAFFFASFSYLSLRGRHLLRIPIPVGT